MINRNLFRTVFCCRRFWGKVLRIFPLGGENLKNEKRNLFLYVFLEQLYINLCLCEFYERIKKIRAYFFPVIYFTDHAHNNSAKESFYPPLVILSCKII